MAVKPLNKSELRGICEVVRDWIHVGSKPLHQVEYLPEPEEGICSWYVIMTNPRCEHRAQSGLIEKGFGTYLPQYRLEKITKRTKERTIIKRSLFPRYMFVWAPEGSWPRITSTDGVEGLVREFGRHGAPVKVSIEAVQALMDRTNEGAFDEMISPLDMPKKMRDPKRQLMKLEPPFAPGEQVRVLTGPFAQFYAVVERAIAGHSADILISIFGRPTPVTVDIAQISAV